MASLSSSPADMGGLFSSGIEVGDHYSDFARSQMERQEQYPLEQGSLWICSPEDIILQKLLWAPNSEKQQRDVLGVMKLQQQKLDFDYLWHWATELGVPEALSAAFEKAGL